MKNILFLLFLTLSPLHAAQDLAHALPDFSYNKRLPYLIQSHINQKSQEQLDQGNYTSQTVHLFQEEQEKHYLYHVSSKKIDLSFLVFDPKTNTTIKNNIRTFIKILKKADNLTEDELKAYAGLAEQVLLLKSTELKKQKNEQKKAYREANKEKISEQQKVYRENHKETIRDQKKANYEANKEKIRKKQKANYEANKEKIGEQQKADYEANKEKKRKQRRDYYKANQETISAQRKGYYKANKKKIREQQRAYHAKKRSEKARLLMQDSNDNTVDMQEPETPSTPFVAEILTTLRNGNQDILEHAEPGTPGHELFESLYSDDETEVEDELLTFASFPNDLASDEGYGDDLFSLGRRKTPYRDDDTKKKSLPRKIQKTA